MRRNHPLHHPQPRKLNDNSIRYPVYPGRFFNQLNKRTEYLVQYLNECSLIARELSIEFDREFPGAQISLKRSARQLRWQWRCFDPAEILAKDHAEHKEKIVSIETRRAQINYALSTAAAELQRLREYRRIENDLLAAA